MNCSFCGKNNEEVYKLIAASETVAICDECVLDCLASLIYPDDDDIEIELSDETTESDSNAQANIGC